MNPEKYTGAKLLLGGNEFFLLRLESELAIYLSERSGEKYTSLRGSDVYNSIVEQVNELRANTPISYAQWFRQNPDLTDGDMTCPRCGCDEKYPDCRTCAAQRALYNAQLEADFQILQRSRNAKTAKAVAPCSH